MRTIGEKIVPSHQYGERLRLLPHHGLKKIQSKRKCSQNFIMSLPDVITVLPCSIYMIIGDYPHGQLVAVLFLHCIRIDKMRLNTLQLNRISRLLRRWLLAGIPLMVCRDGCRGVILS